MDWMDDGLDGRWIGWTMDWMDDGLDGRWMRDWMDDGLNYHLTEE
jgi:hypothetical protein